MWGQHPDMLRDPEAALPKLHSLGGQQGPPETEPSAEKRSEPST